MATPTQSLGNMLVNLPPGQQRPNTVSEALLFKYPKLDQGRVERGWEIVKKHAAIQAHRDEHGVEIKPSDQVWAVRSDTGSGHYIVRPAKRSCTCADSVKGNVCKHRIAVHIIRKFLVEFNASAVYSTSRKEAIQ
jgi:hypothetical protein